MQLKGIIEQIEEKALKKGVNIGEDILSSSKSDEKNSLILPHHQIRPNTERGLVGVTQEFKEGMCEVDRRRADRKKAKKKLNYKELNSHDTSVWKGGIPRTINALLSLGGRGILKKGKV